MTSLVAHYKTWLRRALMQGTPPRWIASTVILLIAGAAAAAYIRQVGLILDLPDPLPPPPLVCIDPGHPTTFNSGRQVVNGATELEINWQVALKLEELLKDRYGVRVIKTRDDQEALMNNPERAQVANEAGAVLMVRLHCDAGPNSGFTVYYPNRQGESLGVTGPTQEVIEASREAAHLMHSGMAEILRDVLKDRGVMGESRTKVGRMQGALTGSVFSEVPVLTIEMVFLTNRSDAEFIKDPGGQDLMAHALANGIMAYVESLPKEKGTTATR